MIKYRNERQDAFEEAAQIAENTYLPCGYGFTAAYGNEIARLIRERAKYWVLYNKSQVPVKRQRKSGK